MKFYFEAEDSEFCVTESDIIRNAKDNGLSTVEVFEAVPLKTLGEYCWCSLYDLVERWACRKSECQDYTPNKSGRGTCIHRGKIYEVGKKVTINVI